MISRQQLDEIITLAVRASERINELRDGNSIDVSYKSDNSPVSSADFQANEIIVEGLQKSFPTIPIVSEEIPESHSRKYDRFFVIDPLDGTRVFLRGEDEFTVNIALVENSVPIIGILAAPALDQMYFNVPGKGVFIGRCFGHDNRFEPVESNRGSHPDNHTYKVLLSKAFSTDKEELLLKDYGSYQTECVSSSIKFALLSVGKGDIYPRFRPTKEWDTAAGHALLLASGGSMIELPSCSNFIYGKDNYWNPPFLAVAKGIPIHCK